MDGSTYSAALAPVYQCRLDCQPDHLTPAWLLGGSEPAGDPAQLVFSEGIAQQGETLWVLDPATRVRNPFVLGPSTWNVLRAWCSREIIPPARSVNLYRAAGIVTTPDARGAALAAWQDTVAACQASLRNGFAPVRGLIHPFQLGALRRYFRGLMRRRLLRFGDRQCPLRYVADNEPAASFFHRQLAPAVSSLLGKAVKPSYSYFIGYQSGAELEEHVDREQCEYTLALCLDFSPEPKCETPWPLQLRLPTRTVVVYQALGDALLYEGRRIPHFRGPLADGCTSTSILFHYVDQDFSGPLK